MPKLTVVRTKKQECYCVVDMRPFRNDASISWKAKGILLYLIDRPKDWVVSYNHLANVSNDGIDSVKTAVKELKDAGYIDIENKRDEHGIIKGWEWTVYENATLRGLQKGNPPDADSPHVANPQCGKPDTGKSHPTKYRGTKDGYTKNRTKYSAEFEALWKKWDDKSDPNNRRGTKRAGYRKWNARIKEGLSVEYLTHCGMNYINDCINQQRYLKNVSTFFGPDRHFEGFEKEVKVESDEERVLREMREIRAERDKEKSNSEKDNAN